MAYKFTEKKKTTQEEMAYIVYMIVGSYFNKATCKSAFVEKRLYLYYMDMRKQVQETKESRVIAQVEQALKEYVPIFGQMNCEVVITHSDSTYHLDFVTGFEKIHAEIDINGGCEMEVAAA